MSKKHAIICYELFIKEPGGADFIKKNNQQLDSWEPKGTPPVPPPPENKALRTY